MNLAHPSERLLRDTMSHAGVYGEFQDPLYNYLVHGFNPGGFFSNVLANDFVGAMSRCHPGNPVDAIKAVCVYLVNDMPESAWGSHQAVEQWLALESNERRAVLEDCGLVYTEPQEVFELLKGTQ